MERKIGEIFERNGEWYQCVKSIGGSCRDCDMNFGCKCPIPIKECTESGRSDKTYVIFKKLEKVGEPITIYGEKFQLLNVKYKWCDKCVFRGDGFCDFPEEINERKCECGASGIYVSIKQNQEDMEEKKDAVLSKLESTGKNLKPFDLEAARSGKPVCTRDGRKARIICFDAKDDRGFHIIALVDSHGCKKELVYSYNNRGICGVNYSIESSEDLMMLPEKHEGWINVFNHGNNDTYVCNMIFATKELAENAVKHMNGVKHFATVKIEWEE